MRAGIEIELVKKDWFEANPDLVRHHNFCRCYRDHERAGCGVPIIDHDIETIPDGWEITDDCSFPWRKGVEVKSVFGADIDWIIDNLADMLTACRKAGYVGGHRDMVGTHITLPQNSNLDVIKIRKIKKVLGRSTLYRPTAPGMSDVIAPGKSSAVSIRGENRIEYRCIESSTNTAKLLRVLRNIRQIA